MTDRPYPPSTPDRVLGDGYVAHELSLAPDPDGDVPAVLVHRVPPPAAPAAPVLVIPGWSDYVFQRDLLEHLASLGLDVWALDPRKHGRSIRPWQIPASVQDLEVLDEEIETALEVIGPERRPLVIAHSTGGLTAALWAARHPGRVRGLVLNSPWLEFHLGPVGRELLRRPLRALARRHPVVRVLPPGHDHYARSLHASHGGALDYDLHWKPPRGHPVTAAMLSAVLEAQYRLSRMTVHEPVLVLTSDASRLGPRWDERKRRADVILDVRGMRKAAARLGPDVSIHRIPGARHDVFLSEPDAAAQAMRTLDTWARDRGVTT